MSDWYHSGLEGYCKAGAEVLGGEGNVLRLCQDILPDRTQESLSRTWKLSNERKGRGNRMSLFEGWWLDDGDSNGTIIKAYRAEALATMKGKVPAGGYSTIEPGSEYELYLQNATYPQDKAYCIHLAESRCEADAVERCVDNIIERSSVERDREAFIQGEQADGVAYVTSIVTMDGFIERVIPAIAKGFICERYRSWDVEKFKEKIVPLAYLAQRYLGDNDNDNVLDYYRKFLTVLVAGLVYGPNHPLVLEKPEPTPHYIAYPTEEVSALRGMGVRLTQVFDGWGCNTGYSELFDAGQVVFIGRSGDLGDYLQRCEDMLKDQPEMLEVLESREQIVFPIAATHASVSRVHGMLLCEEDIWRLYDLGSANRTSIRGVDGVNEERRVVTTERDVVVEGIAKVLPGDRLRFGAPVDASDANVYWDAATLLITLDVSRDMELG